jgi:hypothetical protein
MNCPSESCLNDSSIPANCCKQQAAGYHLEAKLISVSSEGLKRPNLLPRTWVILAPVKIKDFFSTGKLCLRSGIRSSLANPATYPTESIAWETKISHFNIFSAGTLLPTSIRGMSKVHNEIVIKSIKTS